MTSRVKRTAMAAVMLCGLAGITEAQTRPGMESETGRRGILEERQEFDRQVDQRMERLEQQLDELGRAAEEGGEEAQQQWEQTQARIRNEMRDLEGERSRLQQADDAQWPQQRREFEGALGRTERSLQETHRNMTGRRGILETTGIVGDDSPRIGLLDEEQNPMTTVETRLQRLQNEIQEARAQIRQAPEDQRSDLEEELSDLEDQHRQISEDLQAERRDLASNQMDELNSLERDINELVLQLPQGRQMYLDRLQRADRDIDQTMSKLQQQLQQADGEQRQQLQTALNNLQEQRQTLRARLDSLQQASDEEFREMRDDLADFLADVNDSLARLGGRTSPAT